MVRLLQTVAVVALLGVAAARTAPAADDASGPPSAKPVLDLRFAAMPAWRHGPMPWPAVATPFDDKGFVLSAGLASGLRPAFETGHGKDAAWSSLPHEEEAYPDGDAMRVLSRSPFSIQGAALLITAAPLTAAAARTLPPDMSRQYLSGAFNTYPFGQTYGTFEVTARVPSGAGLWPAFWLLPVDRGWPPEIDFGEILGGNSSTAYFSLHSTDAAWVRAEPHSYNASTTTDAASGNGDLSRGFHRYAVEWGPQTISFTLDGVVVGRRATPADMHKPFYLIVNLAVGGVGSWAGPPNRRTRFPATLEIRSVRIWKRVPQ